MISSRSKAISELPVNGTGNELALKAILASGNAILKRDLLAIINGEGIYSFISEAYTTILGYDSDDLIGQCAFNFIHPEDLIPLKKRFGFLITIKRIARFHIDIVGKTEAMPG